MNLWQSLPRPFLVLAPLEGVADTVFRQIVSSCARPDVFVTEFTSADGFCSKGRDIVSQNLRFTRIEEPIIAQIWGKNPEAMYQTAYALASRGFSGIDINMGCPERTVVRNGCGSALIETPELAASLIRAVKKGVADAGSTIPVSVKTRIGLRRMKTESWITFLLGQKLDCVTVHGRTAAEMSKVPAHWDEIEKAVRIRDEMRVPTVIVGNGDVQDVKDAQAKHARYGVDGVMIGRGIFTNLWAFDRSASPHVAEAGELLDLMEKHVQLFTETWGKTKNYAILKKFFKIYVNGFYGATEARVACMATQTPEEVLAIIRRLKNSDALRSPARV